MDERTSGGLCQYGMCACMHMCVRVCVCVCENMYVCSTARRIRSRERNGQMEARRHEWMGLCGEGVTPFEIQPCILEGRRGGWLSAFEANAALLEFKGCRLFGGFQPRTPTGEVG